MNNEKSIQPSKENPEIKIGDYTLSYYHHGDLWLEHKTGEGMQVSPSALEKVIDKFFEENF